MQKFIPLSIFIFCSCNLNNQQSDITSNKFKFPVIIQQSKTDSVEQWDTNGINEIFPIFIGQYKFIDTINLNERESRNIDEKQYKWERNVFDFDTLSSDGLEIYAYYQKTIIFKRYSEATKGSTFFSVYIVNETNEPKLFIAKDRYVFAIQEAVDTSNYNSWYAIEAKGFDFCGDGYFRRKLLPKEFIVFLMPKYSGIDTTYLRTRIKIGESIVVSKPYRGSFDKRQFKVTSGNTWSKELKQLDYKWMFYGARNK